MNKVDFARQNISVHSAQFTVHSFWNNGTDIKKQGTGYKFKIKNG
ncbi:hypothetical protein SDC9_48921 [bioreactor metagenome]|uniref:Uncharacterized protein n=1 Tax=bioreactor metagenome TaxID=1076179 RepID=A0A644WFP5_9ZZZZ